VQEYKSSATAYDKDGSETPLDGSTTTKKEEGGGGAIVVVIVVVVIAAAIGIGVGVYCHMKGKKDAAEGGEEHGDRAWSPSLWYF